MKIAGVLLAVSQAGAAFADGDSPVVRLDECPKCDRRTLEFLCSGPEDRT